MYCFDAASIIHAWVRVYPPDVAPGFWEQFNSKIDEGLIIAPEEVRVEELLAPDDLREWARQRDKMFRDLDEPFQVAVRKVVTDIQADTRRKGLMLRDRDFKGDPFVVALASITGRAVVTQETRNRSPGQGHPKIPNICEWYGVKCIDILTFMREQRILLR